MSGMYAEFATCPRTCHLDEDEDDAFDVDVDVDVDGDGD